MIYFIYLCVLFLKLYFSLLFKFLQTHLLSKLTETLLSKRFNCECINTKAVSLKIVEQCLKILSGMFKFMLTTECLNLFIWILKQESYHFLRRKYKNWRYFEKNGVNSPLNFFAMNFTCTWCINCSEHLIIPTSNL